MLMVAELILLLMSLLLILLDDGVVDEVGVVVNHDVDDVFANDTGVVNIADILVIFGILVVGTVVVKGKW